MRNICLLLGLVSIALLTGGGLLLKRYFNLQKAFKAPNYVSIFSDCTQMQPKALFV